MFSKILVPVDLTPESPAALEVVAELGARASVVVTLIHVVETIEHVEYEEIQEFYETLRQKAGQKLADYGARLAERGVEADTEIALGKPAQEIVRYAAAGGFDLIVLDSHRVDPAEPAKGWGSLSHRVAIFAQCPVLLVK